MGNNITTSVAPATTAQIKLCNDLIRNGSPVPDKPFTKFTVTEATQYITANIKFKPKRTKNRVYNV